MRVGLVCPYSFDTAGGVQNHVLGLAGWLVRTGHDPHLLAPGRLDADRAVRHGVDPGRFTSLGRTVPVPYNGSVARIAFGPVSRRRVRRWLAAGAYDVLHVHEPITPSAAVLAVWEARGTPVVATFHTSTPRSRTMGAARRLMPGTVTRLDAGIAVSQVAADVTRRHLGVDPEVIGNGVTVADFDGLPAGDDRPRVVCVPGRLHEPRKGLGVFLAAAARLVDEVPGLDVVVIGAGARPRGAPRQVRFVGAVTDAERNRLLAASDVMVASHVGRESFGIVLLEALAAGAEVVASDLPAFRTVLDDGQGPVGRLFPAGDAAALADAVRRALAEPYDPARGRARAAAFDWGVVGPQVVAVYERVVARAHR